MSALLKFDEKLKELVDVAVVANGKHMASASDAFHLHPEDPRSRKEEEKKLARLGRDELVVKLTSYLNSVKKLKF